jgi:uncharacterized protein YndB with AHSA1/START domain
MHITRQVVLDADRDELWHALIDEEARAEWLEDERPIEVVALRPGAAITWRWCAPDRHGTTSTVAIELETIADGRTKLTVTERRTAAPSCTIADATVDVDTWDRHLLGLELRCVLRAAASVAV